MVPVAIGSQTGGSNLRPAAYNGVYGFKGSYGRIGRAGCIPVSYSLDHPGIIAVSVDDLALVFSVLAGHDSRDRTTLVAEVPPPTPVGLKHAPRLGLVRSFFLDQAEPEMAVAIERAADQYQAVGAEVSEAKLPDLFETWAPAHRLILSVEMAHVHARRHSLQHDLMAPKHRTAVEVNALVPATYYLKAQQIRQRLVSLMADMFVNFDALIMPATPGAAPEGLESTGDASMLSPWSFVGFPAATIPVGLSASGLPLGLQIVGGPLHDGLVLSVAKWCSEVTGLLPPPPGYAS
jgi:aspartyl-tRNA(Asn)/glutamyl-tRNA(Gln) amidotransferase subunit A